MEVADHVRDALGRLTAAVFAGERQEAFGLGELRVVEVAVAPVVGASAVKERQQVGLANVAAALFVARAVRVRGFLRARAGAVPLRERAQTLAGVFTRRGGGNLADEGLRLDARAARRDVAFLFRQLMRRVGDQRAARALLEQVRL